MLIVHIYRDLATRRGRWDYNQALRCSKPTSRRRSSTSCAVLRSSKTLTSCPIGLEQYDGPENHDLRPNINPFFDQNAIKMPLSDFDFTRLTTFFFVPALRRTPWWASAPPACRPGPRCACCRRCSFQASASSLGALPLGTSGRNASKSQEVAAVSAKELLVQQLVERLGTEGLQLFELLILLLLPLLIASKRLAKHCERPRHPCRSRPRRSSARCDR